MAVTKIHSITATETKALTYITNPEKTDNGRLVFSFGCDKHSSAAHDDFEQIRSLGTGRTSVLSRHLIFSFEGQEVTPQTRLNPNGYKRNGWGFLGWNTEADGSGNFYENEAEILNLCEEEYRPGENMGTVKLYAMWKKASGRLSIMLIGSSYYGKMGMYTVTVPYGDKYDIDINKLSGGKGFYVAFVSNGAESIPKINTVRK